MEDLDKLGVFYLGKTYDLSTRQTGVDPILYDSKDLVTHAVCVGMTGSGKTGLCVSLIEEAALDAIPAIVIDPKGDLTNLLLTFPELRGEDFLPWINEEDALKKGLTPEQFAREQAETWSNGLSDWGQNGDRIRRLKEAAEFAIYTPGSNAGIPVSILKSFAAPGAAIRDDNEAMQERINTTATSLLGLLGIQADPLQSREHILLATILHTAWKQGQDLDLTTLIKQVQTPPVTQIGVLDIEAFYPAKDRFGLVMALNNLLAAPGFSAWLEGVPLDIGQILHTAEGRPRIAVFSISHLGDAERMFFVSLLLNQVLGWMRAQPGTNSLRAILYMDEIFGYFPPVANPPSKLPLLTLLKQARAFGVGVVLATQNPVDLDYKGLANTGTWFVGRLQTERDKARVLDGLESVATTTGSGFDRSQIDTVLSSLGNRVFLLNNTHEDAPVVMQTRWAMSYLRGPLTREQIRRLMEPARLAVAATPVAAAPAPQPVAPAASTATAAPAAGGPPLGPAPAMATASAAVAPAAGGAFPPTLPGAIPQYFIPVRGLSPSGGTLKYLPRLFGLARVRFADSKLRVDSPTEACLLTPISDDPVPVRWENAQAVSVSTSDLEKTAQAGAEFASLPAAAGQVKSYVAWSREFVNWLYGAQSLQLLRSPSLDVVSEPGEEERDFRVRLGQASREQRDEAVERLRQKYAAKITQAQERVRRAQEAVAREQEQANQQKMQTAISFGSTLLSAVMGRKAASMSALGRATTAARGVGRSMKEQQDIAQAEDTLETRSAQLEELEAQIKAETDELMARIDPLTEPLETVSLRPKKTDIAPQLVALVWEPQWVTQQGEMIQAWG